jgi:hypothetical protein
MDNRVIVMTYNKYMLVLCSNPEKQYLIYDQEFIGNFVDDEFKLVERRKDDKPAIMPTENELKAINSILVVAKAVRNTINNIG